MKRLFLPVTPAGNAVPESKEMEPKQAFNIYLPSLISYPNQQSYRTAALNNDLLVFNAGI